MADVLRVAVETLRTLKSILSPTYGPNGIDVALRCDSGSILVTNSGYCIIDSLSMAHPIGVLICEQVKRHVGITGDGSKEMIILLSVLLENISNSTYLSTNFSKLTAINSAVASACAQLNNSMKEKILGDLERHSFEHHLDDDLHIKERTEKFYISCRHVLKTTLNGKFSPSVVDLLVEKSIELISHNKKHQTDFSKHVNNLIDNFQDICVTADGIDIANTRVISGFVIKQYPIEKPPNIVLGVQRRFVLMKDIFDTNNIQFGKISIEFNRINSDSFLKSRLSVFHRAFDALDSKGVNLILCSCKIPDYIQSFCKKKFSVLQCMQDEEITRISNYFRILPIGSTEEILYEDFSSKIGVLSHADELVIGTERYSWLCPDNSYKDLDEVPCQLILCSSHPAIGKQYYSAVLRMLKVLKMCFYDEYGTHQIEHKSIFKYIPGAGFSEAYIARCLQYEAKHASDESMEIVCKSLSSACLEILRLLNKNAYHPQRRFIEIENEILNTTQEVSFGIDGNNGKDSSPHQTDIIEPFSSKILLLSHVLQVAQQILRIEQIVPSRNPINIKPKTSME
ncbi:Bardet-Biedl syndrome 10 protein-like [Rhopilema esculentum]|uniref:Bardet-Biedl syndrome 10 protein-like n=1 Tax=Rhopilema esculentum TaxID=499914 RepID=UPI0031D29809|eukprot:gene1580-16032_t